MLLLLIWLGLVFLLQVFLFLLQSIYLHIIALQILLLFLAAHQVFHYRAVSLQDDIDGGLAASHSTVVKWEYFLAHLQIHWVYHALFVGKVDLIYRQTEVLGSGISYGMKVRHFAGKIDPQRCALVHHNEGGPVWVRVDSKDSERSLTEWETFAARAPPAGQLSCPPFPRTKSHCCLMTLTFSRAGSIFRYFEFSLSEFKIAALHLLELSSRSLRLLLATAPSFLRAIAWVSSVPFA